MASSTAFRGRRIADPVAIQRRPFPRDKRERPSFSDVAAALQNVGEVKSALQAAEARINEANAELQPAFVEESLDEHLQEIFSETQRYGRVARFELRPDLQRRPGEVTSSGNNTNSRQSHLNIDRPGHSVRPPQLSPPSREMMPDVRPTLHHASRNDIEELSLPIRNPTFSSTYSSVPLTRDPVFTSTNTRQASNHAVPAGLSGSLMFEDSLEVPLHHNSHAETRAASSLGLRDSVANNSALSRLKERIKQQKENSTRQRQTEASKVVHREDTPAGEIQANDDNSAVPSMEESESYSKPLSKRKIASAPAAPAYKGFSEIEQKSRPVMLKEVGAGQKAAGPGHDGQKRSFKPNTKTGKAHKRPVKPNQDTGRAVKKGGPKLQRITAPRCPMDVITTSSWRSGQETVKRILGPSKKPPTRRPQSTAKQETDTVISERSDSTISKKSSLEWKSDKSEEKGERDLPVDRESVVRRKQDEEQVDGEISKDESELSRELHSKSEESDLEDVKELRASQVLSREAKNVLSDLELSSDDSDKETRPPVRSEAKPMAKTKPTARKSGAGVKRKAFASQQKQEPAYSKPKSRHYDSDQVKKYMAKQVARRKQMMKDERLMKQKAVEERKKKLEEVFNKQKRNLAVNLALKEHRRYGLGETFSKEPAGLHHIPSYRHPFEEEEKYSEDTEVGESDKENFDVASFKGLPSQWQERSTFVDGGSKDSRSEHSLSDHDVTESGPRDMSRGAVRAVVISTQPMAADSLEVTNYPGFSQDSLEEGRIQEEQSTAEAVGEIRDVNPGAKPPLQSSILASDVTDHKPAASPQKADRIAAIREKAAELKERLETEARRLGLNFRSSPQEERVLTPAAAAPPGQSAAFAGALPGVASLREQADLNHQLQSMNVAATRIQAAYRGHSVRQGLDWRLPSGRTLGAIMREAQHKSGTSQSGAERAELSSNSTSWETVVQNEEPSLSEEQRSYSASYAHTASLLKCGSSLKESVQLSSDKISQDFSSSRLPLSSHCPQRPPLQVKKPWEQTSGDRHSVINIYTRNHPSLRLVEEDSVGEHGSETASLLEQSMDDTASLLEEENELPADRKTAESPDGGEHEYEDDFTGSAGDGASTKRSPGQHTTLGESYSESFVNPEPIPNQTLESGPLSPTLSEGSLSPVEQSSLVSSRRSPTPEVRGTQTQPDVPPERLPPSVFVPSHQGGDRLSPGSLDHRLTAELNKLEYMEESVRQLTDIEQTRAVSLAQQETVSLAQILKARQLSHSRDMENLQLKARQEALEAAKQLEEARHAAADAAAQAAHTIAQLRTEAATAISDSTERLVKVQTEAARSTMEASKQVEEARTSAAQSRIEAANQYSSDMRDVVVSAASAAAEAAVKSSMAQLKVPQRTSKSRTSDSYTDYTPSERTSTYTKTQTSRSVTDRRGERSGSHSAGAAYTSDEFDSFVESRPDGTQSIKTASDVTEDLSAGQSPLRTASHSAGPSESRDRGSSQSVADGSESIPEEVEHSISESVMSEDDRSRERGKKDKLDDTVNLDETLLSSRTVTDDERDYRMVLPSESHRRGLVRSKRSGSVGSDMGTVSYSSDENHDACLSELSSQKLLADSAPFSAEESFSKFTAVMVGLMKEEEARAKHLESLLHLREEALKEKTQAEMSWLELQKKRRDKGSDDVMPSIRKRLRGVRMRQQAEQAEIKRLMAANRAASYERRLLLLQQEEIARLRKTTQKIREKVKDSEGGAGAQKTENKERKDVDHSGNLESRSKPDSTDAADVPEELDKSADLPSQSRSPVTEDIKSPAPSRDASIAEELSSFQPPTASGTQSFPTYVGSQEEAEESVRDRKRMLSEEESDERTAVFKVSPSVSDSTVMKKLKKLRRHSGERYLTQREQKLREKRKEAESLLEDQKKLLEWEKRLDEEENRVKNLLNEALNLKTTRRKDSVTSEEGEHTDRRVSVGSPLVNRSASSQLSDKNLRNTERSPSISEQIKTQTSTQRNTTDSSVAEEIPNASRDVTNSKSRDTSIPEESIGTPSRSQGTSIPEDIPEEYGNDTFESLDSSSAPNHSTPMRTELSSRRETASTVSRASSKEEENKSEEEASYTETSDHSDIESRVRHLKDQLEHRKKEAKRLYHERKRQRKSMLRAQEASLRKQLQAVELVITNTKADLDKGNRPQQKPPPSPQSLSEAPASEVPARNTEHVPTKARAQHRPSKAPQGLSESHATEVQARSTEYAPTSKASESESQNVEAELSAEHSEETDSVAESIHSVKEGARLDSEQQNDLDASERASTRDRSPSEGARSFSETDRQDSLHQDRESSSTKEELEEDAKTAEDNSLSVESESRTLSKQSERSSHEGQRKSASSGEIPTASEASRSSRRTPSIPEEYSRTASIADSYSSSFESKATTRSQESVSEDVKEDKRASETTDEIKTESGKGSEIPEDITDEDLSERSLSEALSAKNVGSGAESRDTSIADEVEEAEILSIHSDDELAPIYTPDFEPSEAKDAEKSEASKYSARQGVPSEYSADFERSETKSVEDTGTSGRKDRSPDFSFSEMKSVEKGDAFKLSSENGPSDLQVLNEDEKRDTSKLSAQEEISDMYPSDFEPSSAGVEQTGEVSLERLLQPQEEKGTGGRRDQKPAPMNVPRLEVEEPADEESVAEELPLSEEERSKDATQASAGLPEVVLPRSTPMPDAPSVDEAVERVTDQLASVLFAEAINCITDMYKNRRQLTGNFEEDFQTKEAFDGARDRTDGHRVELIANRGVVGSRASRAGELKERTRTESPESDETLKTEEESPSIEQSSGDEESVSGLDFRTKAKGKSEPTQEIVGKKEDSTTRRDLVASQLTDKLLNEAATQMINIMRRKREKARAAAPNESKTSPVGGQEAKSPSCPSRGKFIESQRFAEPMPPRHSPEGPRSPHGSPTGVGSPPLDGKELMNKLSMLEQLHDELEDVLRRKDDDDDDDFDINVNKILEPPSEDDDEFGRPRRGSVLYVVPHSVAEVNSLVTSALSVYFDHKSAGLPLTDVEPPPELLCNRETETEDLKTTSERVYKKLVFDLTGDVLSGLLAEEVPSHRPSWMKAKRRRKTRAHYGLHPPQDQLDFLPIVRQRVSELVGLGEIKSSVEAARRKTPVKMGKKDFVDAILIQELREEEPQWVDYDDDELAVKFQVADAIFESLLSETVMVMNTVQDRRDARREMLNY